MKTRLNSILAALTLLAAMSALCLPSCRKADKIVDVDFSVDFHEVRTDKYSVD